MKNKKQILIHLARSRHRNNVKRKFAKRNYVIPDSNKSKQEELNIAQIKYDLLSDNLKHIADCEKTNVLEYSFDYKRRFSKVKTIKIPKVFSLIENPDESYAFIKEVVNCIYHNRVRRLRLNYVECEIIHLGAQAYLDVLLKDIFVFARNLAKKHPSYSLLESVKPVSIKNDNVEKLLRSIGSFAIHRNESKKYPDIVPYPLCDFKINSSASKLFNIETKERHVTEMVQYVIDSLDRMNQELSGDSIEDLSIIIGEILINAEEHSTNKHRFSIGYFQEHTIELETLGLFGTEKHKFSTGYIQEDDGNKEKYGIFNLVILNFGDTIYDTFKSVDCPRQDIVSQMKDLSKKYTSRNLFGKNINEETLWTLYALQEEITSVSPEKNKKRGNGSIKFIESFFNLKGENGNLDDTSRLAVLSGNTSIVFDGTYGTQEIKKENESFKVMTFNDSGDISDKPDAKYVKFVQNHFPGTIISAQILISKNDLL